MFFFSPITMWSFTNPESIDADEGWMLLISVGRAFIASILGLGERLT